MTFSVRLPEGTTTRVALNRCGYATFRDPNTNIMSFVRRLGAHFYPRFHVYINEGNTRDASLSLHLDMKQTTHIAGKTHSGEYDGEQVERERDRILHTLSELSAG